MSCRHYWLFHKFSNIDVMVLRCQNCNRKLVTSVSPLAIFLYLLKPYMSGARFYPSELRYAKMFANVKTVALRLTEEQLNDMIRAHRRQIRRLVRWRRQCRVAMVVL
jgi:hypothetical protein